MSIESVVAVNDNPTKLAFPKLRRHESKTFIVLFLSPKIGTIVWKTEACSFVIGEHSVHWNSMEFEDFKDIVRLSNV